MTGVLEQMLELQRELQALDPSCCGGDDAVLAMRANKQLRRETVDHALIMTVVGAKQARVITSMLGKLPAAVIEEIPAVEARPVGFAATLDAAQLAQAAALERAYLDPDGGHRNPFGSEAAALRAAGQ